MAARYEGVDAIVAIEPAADPARKDLSPITDRLMDD
jgi:hypothetical protein